jgi:hypothetical protein
MTPALLSDLENACHPHGISTPLWVCLLLLGIIGTYLVVKTLLGQTRLPGMTLHPHPVQTGVLIVILPSLLLLPVFGLLQTQERKSELKTLLALLQTPQKNLLTIEENPKTLKKTYKIQKLPRYQIISLAGKPTQTTETTTPFIIPSPFAQVLEDHQALQKP